MTAQRDSTAPLMSLRLGIALVLVSAIAFVGALVLSAFASDFRSETNGGTNALSKSAVGFAGLYALLSETGVPVSINRRGAAARSTCWLAVVGNTRLANSKPKYRATRIMPMAKGATSAAAPATTIAHDTPSDNSNRLVKSSTASFNSTDAPITIAATTTASTINQRIAPRILNRCSSAGAVPSFSNQEA